VVSRSILEKASVWRCHGSFLLLLPCRELAFLLGQVLTGRGLVFLDDLLAIFSITG
jgi:hypothetical protein